MYLENDDEKRLLKLQKSENDRYNFSSDLTYKDIILLLKYDDKLRQLIREIVSNDNNNYNDNVKNNDVSDENYNETAIPPNLLGTTWKNNSNDNFTELSNLKNENSVLQNENNSLKDENNDLQNENHNLKNTIDDLQSKLDFANNSADDFKKENENLVENLSYLKNQNVNLQNDLNSAKNSANDFKNKYKNLVENLSNLEKENKNLQKEIDTLKQHSMPADFNEMLEILQHLKSQNNLATIWLGDDYANADLTMNIQRFIARAGNWTNIELFWDTLRKQCEITKQEISAQNLKLLTMLIQLYNYSRSDDKRATLLFSLEENGNKYNSFEQMRASFCVSGENVSQELLPGLKSAFDKVIKQAIVITKD